MPPFALDATGSRSTAEAPYLVPYGRAVSGSVHVPGSKSFTNRYLNLALLTRAPLTLENPLVAEDAEVFLTALAALGFSIERGEGRLTLSPGKEPSTAPLECGFSGTMLRFLLAALATRPGVWEIDGQPRLRERPVGPLVAVLRELGVEIEWLGEPGFAPLRVWGRRWRGGRVTLDASASSQYLSALLMAALAAGNEVEISAPALTSEPYVAITLDAITQFGGRVECPAPRCFRVHPGFVPPAAVTVEGDLSAACYWAAAAALTGGRVELPGLSRSSPQGDRRFFDLLQEMGAEVRWSEHGAEVRGTGRLVALEANLAGLPDQVPTLAALAPFAHGTTRITGVPHLRLKESDRLAAMARELTRVGARVEERADGLTLEGSWAVHEPPREPVEVATHNDHRIAMSLAVLGLRRPGVSIAQPSVVAKSYPGFWRDFQSLLRG